MYSSSAWSDPAEVELLARLWVEGQSASQVAKAINATFASASYSRNAVIGKIHRLGLKDVGRGKPAKPAARIATPRRAPRATVLKLAGGATVHHDPVRRPPRATFSTAAFEPLPGSSPKPWTQREFGECSWPVGGEGADLLHCCLPTERRWCADHAARGTVRPLQGSRNATELTRGLRRFIGA